MCSTADLCKDLVENGGRGGIALPRKVDRVPAGIDCLAFAGRRRGPVAHIRQSWPDVGLGFQADVFRTT